MYNNKFRGSVPIVLHPIRKKSSVLSMIKKVAFIMAIIACAIPVFLLAVNPLLSFIMGSSAAVGAIAFLASIICVAGLAYGVHLLFSFVKSIFEISKKSDNAEVKASLSVEVVNKMGKNVLHISPASSNISPTEEKYKKSKIVTIISGIIAFGVITGLLSYYVIIPVIAATIGGISPIGIFIAVGLAAGVAAVCSILVQKLFGVIVDCVEKYRDKKEDVKTKLEIKDCYLANAESTATDTGSVQQQ